MSVCHAASIVLDEESVAFFGPENAHWRVPLERIRVLGEVRSSLLEDGHYLAILIDDSGAWLQAPVRAAGMEQAVQRLGIRLDHPMTLQLAQANAESSRVIWPQGLEGEPLLESNANGRMIVREYILEWIGTSSRTPPR